MILFYAAEILAIQGIYTGYTRTCLYLCFMFFLIEAMFKEMCLLRAMMHTERKLWNPSPRALPTDPVDLLKSGKTIPGTVTFKEEVVSFYKHSYPICFYLQLRTEVVVINKNQGRYNWFD